MTHSELESTDEIFDTIRANLTSSVAGLTNFTENSFNFLFAQAFSEEIRELQELTLVSELAGFIDFTGGGVTQEQIDNLDIEGDISADRVNDLMQDEYLDEFVKIVGVTRDEGERATGNVTFQTQLAETDIPEGTSVTTQPDSDGDTLEFLTTDNVRTDNTETTVSGVDIQAVDVGEDFNVAANTVNRISNPPVGVISVTNPESTTGGEEVESNEDLRKRAKAAVGGASEGGTTEGIKAFIRNNVEGIQTGDVIIDEFFDGADGQGGAAPFVDVIVDGGLDSEVRDAIETSRPTGIEHNLVRPEVVQIGGDIAVLGVDVSTSSVLSAVEDFLLTLGIGENLFRDQLIRELMNSDNDIVNLSPDLFIERVTNETFTFDDTRTDYRLDYTYDEEFGSVTVRDRDGNLFVEGSDYELVNDYDSSLPFKHTLRWIGTTPTDGERFFVDYDVTAVDSNDNQLTRERNEYETDLVRDEEFAFDLGRQDSFDFNLSTISYQLSGFPFGDNVSVVDQSGTTFTEDVDFQLAPLQDSADEDTFTFDAAQLDYSLSEEVLVDDVAIIDADGNIFERGVDFTVVDTDGNGFAETIRWDDTQSNPADTKDFTVNYNNFANHIRWDLNDTVPSQDDTFTVTYDRSVYETDLEIVSTPERIIKDSDNTIYDEGTEYEIVDLDKENEDDAIRWSQRPSTLSDGENFYFDYITEGDIVFGDREKADPGTIDVVLE